MAVSGKRPATLEVSVAVRSDRVSTTRVREWVNNLLWDRNEPIRLRGWF